MAEKVTWAVCLKCGSKFDTRPLERKQIFACQLCKEPGLRIMDAKGEATDETWPKEEAG
jgi:DNA-directed RNA polymerase subunit RPC12/RpoP